MNYLTHVLDCDGVMVASNAVKENAFYEAALQFSSDPNAARALVEYHKRAGAIGRRARIEYFFSDILHVDQSEADIDCMLDMVTKYVVRGMADVPVMPGLYGFLRHLKARAVCVSGIEQSELEWILTSRNLMQFFDGIYGTNDKTETLFTLLRNHVIELPAIYYGDTEDDYRAARSNGLDFVLIYGGQSQGSPLRAAKDFTQVKRIR